MVKVMSEEAAKWYAYGHPLAPASQYHDSPSPCVRPMLAEHLHKAEEYRSLSRTPSINAPVSPFRSGSPFEHEYWRITLHDNLDDDNGRNDGPGDREDYPLGRVPVSPVSTSRDLTNGCWGQVECVNSVRDSLGNEASCSHESEPRNGPTVIDLNDPTRTPSLSPPYMHPAFLEEPGSQERSKVEKARMVMCVSPDDIHDFQRGFDHDQIALSLGFDSVSASFPGDQSMTVIPEHATSNPSVRIGTNNTHSEQASVAGSQQSGKLDPKWNCDICGKSFSRRDVLHRHQRVHADERPFACSIEGCEEAFKQKNDRTRHVQSKHGNQRSVCGGQRPNGKVWGCGASFPRPDGLVEHHKKTQVGRRCIAAKDHDD